MVRTMFFEIFGQDDWSKEYFEKYKDKFFILGGKLMMKNGYNTFEMLSRNDNIRPDVLLAGGVRWLWEASGLPFPVSVNTCSFKEDAIYHFDREHGSGCSLYCLDGDVTAFRDYYEKQIFPEYDPSKLHFEEFNGEEMDNLNLPIWDREHGHVSITGFHYFWPRYDRCKERKFLCAMQDDHILGVILYGTWADGPLSLSYIDVSEPYRSKGIATALIKELAKRIGDQHICLSHESEMGKKCHMGDLFMAHMNASFD